MIANPKSDVVGDSKAPALKPDGVALRDAVDQAMAMLAEPAPTLALQSPAASMAACARRSSTIPSTSCQQNVWLSFFFDGTGNNLDADVGTQKHTNVAKLYRAHEENDPVLAYAKGAQPGADPAPGVFDGHSGWGGKMKLMRWKRLEQE